MSFDMYFKENFELIEIELNENFKVCSTSYHTAIYLYMTTQQCEDLFQNKHTCIHQKKPTRQQRCWKIKTHPTHDSIIVLFSMKICNNAPMPTGTTKNSPRIAERKAEIDSCKVVAYFFQQDNAFCAFNEFSLL